MGLLIGPQGNDPTRPGVMSPFGPGVMGPGIGEPTTNPFAPPPAPPVVNYDQVRADYGNVIPISMGTRRMPGQIVWASKTYGTFPDIYVDVGVSFGYNGDSVPADTEFTKIWANGTKIWTSSAGELLPDLGSITTYSGTTTQDVDPLYEADVGADNATAFRGQLVAFIRGLPLINFNYMMPGISAEISGTVEEETPPGGGQAQSVIVLVALIPQSGTFSTTAVNTGGGTAAQYARSTNGWVDSYYFDLVTIAQDLGVTSGTIEIDGTKSAGSFVIEVYHYSGGTVGLGAGGAYQVSGGSEVASTSGGSMPVTFNWSISPGSGGGGEPVDLDSITIQGFLERAAEYAGLDPATDLEFGSGTDDTISGGLLHEEESFGSLAQRAVRYAGWDMFEGDKITFVKKVAAGGSYTLDATIPAADLLDQGDRAITTNRREDNESPVQLALSYIDRTQQFKYNTQRARRILYPTRTTQSRRRDGFAVPFVITASEALTRAAQAMFRDVTQNVLHEFDLPPEYIYLEPGDIIDITAGDTSYVVKINRIEIGANLALKVYAVNLMTDEDLELEASSGDPLEVYDGDPLLIITGTMAATDGADSFAATSLTIGTGPTGTDGADGFSATGTVAFAATMTGTDGADSASMSGTAVHAGTMTGTDGADSASMTGTVASPAETFATALGYTGNGGTNAITGAEFEPDLVIVKRRGATNGWRWTDSVRGVGASLASDSFNGEATEATGVTAFGADGFTLGADADYNTNAATYLALAFKEVAGAFDIVTYTGNGANRTIAHSLGVVPEVMIIKSRGATIANWIVYSDDLTGNTFYLTLNSTAAQSSTNGEQIFNSTSPTSSEFALGTNATVNGNTVNYVAYLFASMAGKSKIGTYTGTGTTSGPTITTGFRPKFIITKRINSTSDWQVWDTVRDASSPHAIYSLLNTTAAEATSGTGGITIGATSFQITDSVQSNVSGGTYLYMAFGEED